MSLLLTSLTLLCVLGISVGQLLFKKAAMLLPPQPAITDWLFNGWLIVALALYIFIVKFLGLVMKAKKQEAAAPPPPTRDQELLMEIRDLLKQKAA